MNNDAHNGYVVDQSNLPDKYPTHAHDAAFWETFKEMVRVVKPGGLIYICTPSSGNEHCLPDRWRFLSGAYPALESWVDNVKLLESYIDPRDHWKDAIGIFCVLEE